jgi:uncharacterized protein YydD (DUF2326 family)
LFDGVDERQAAKAFGLVQAICAEEKFQYISTMNSDYLKMLDSMGLDLRQLAIEPHLTDAFETGGLFGFRFD